MSEVQGLRINSARMISYPGCRGWPLKICVSFQGGAMLGRHLMAPRSSLRNFVTVESLTVFGFANHQ